MDPVPLTLALIPLLIFWMWMFWEMMRDERIVFPAKTYWALAFVVLNIFTAVYYYATFYRDKG